MLDVVVADRPEELIDELVDRLAAPLADPFAREWVSVPSLGFRNWLRQELSLRLGARADGAGDGIVANIDLPFPGALRWLVLDAHRAHTGVAEQADPWSLDRLVWSVLEVLADPPPGLEPRLSARSAGVPLSGRAAAIADLFDRYAVHRPEMVLDWLDGADAGSDGATLDAAHRWQPQLYRAVHAHIAQRHAVSVAPSQRLLEALDLLTDGTLQVGATGATGAVALPPRLFIAGQSMITAELGPVLQALSHQVDVSMLLLSPSARTSCRLAAAVAKQPPLRGRRAPSWSFPRSAPQASPELSHPLSSAWGQRSMESAMLLGAGGVVPRVGAHAGSSAAPRTLLERLQRDLRDDELPDTPFEPSAADRSVQVHAAPGRTRQVEALRDSLLGLLRDLPDLAESDIAVVCPQLEQFAPILAAVLGPPAERGEQPLPDRPPSLRYTVIDRSARSFNPVFDAMAGLLDVVAGRLDATGVRSLLQSPAVRERFGLTAGDLSLLSDWVEAARIRWGRDGEHRRRWGIDVDSDVNSWAAGLDQLMMGVAIGDDLLDAPLPGAPAVSSAGPTLALGRVVPMPLADGDLAGAGRLAEALRSLAAAQQLLVDRPARPIAQWQADLNQIADLMVAAQRFEGWQRTSFDELVASLVTASADPDGTPSPVPVDFDDVRRLLSGSLSGARSRADLGFGSIVVARPALLASVPFRVVAVLGVDTDALPTGGSGGDDLLAFAPMVGDRDPRAESRAELLGAIAMARDALVITCTSRDVRNNAVVPVAVALDELQEVLAATLGISVEALRSGHGGVVSDHPRQAFDDRNFVAPPDGQPSSFDPVALAGAFARRGRPVAGVAPSVLLDSPLPEEVDHDAPVELEQLRWFFAHPVRTFFRSRLNVVVPRRSSRTDDELPTSVASLDASAIGAALLGAGLATASVDDVHLGDDAAARSVAVATVLEAARARGVLPPDSLARQELVAIADEVAELLERAEGLGVRTAARLALPVDIHLPDGTRLVGSVPDCIDSAGAGVGGTDPGPVRLGYSRPKPHHRVAAAIDLFALTLTDPEPDWRAVLIRRAESSSGGQPTVWVVGVAGADARARHATAAAALATLVSQYRDGLRYPLPLFDGTSRAVHDGRRGTDAWGDPTNSKGKDYDECRDPYHVQAFGRIDFHALRGLVAGGHTLDGEADRLWGTLDRSLTELPSGGPE